MSPILALVAVGAASYADLDTIDMRVAAFTGAGIGEAGGASGPVDRRLRLQPCASGLRLSWRTRQRDSVVVQCADAGGWRLFVPVNGSGAAPGGQPAVSRGDSVTITITGEGFSVSRPGEAMETGPVGAWIKVRSANAAQRGSTDVIQARVLRPGLVGVPLP